MNPPYIFFSRSMNKNGSKLMSQWKCTLGLWSLVNMHRRFIAMTYKILCRGPREDGGNEYDSLDSPVIPVFLE